jgi:hypothetical protein
MKYICRHCGEETNLKVSDGVVASDVMYCSHCNKDLGLNEVITPWNLDARIKQLTAMHEMMCQANDEMIYMSWITFMPDGATEEDIKYIALDDEEYNECFDFFIKLIKKEGNRW